MEDLQKIKYLFLLCLLLTNSIYSCAQTKVKPNTKKPLVVFVTGDHNYSSEETMPLIAAELEENYDMRTLVLKSFPDHTSEENIPGLEALKEANLAVFYLRWRRLPIEQIRHIEDYLKSGKPVIGFRTSTHAFNYPKGHALERWNAFGEFALNAPPGWGGTAHHSHYSNESSTDVTIIPRAAENPILIGVDKEFFSNSPLYTVLPDFPTKGSDWLLMGHPVNPEKDNVIDHPVAWIGTNSFGGKVFMTTLGHPEDFDLAPFQRLVLNAIHWAIGLPVPEKWAGKIEMNVPFRQPKK